MGDLSELLYRVDAVKFARDRLAFHPDERQTEVLGRRLRRALLNCTRQWGKSTITAAKAVHRAYVVLDSLTVVLTPSARQSGEFLRKAAGFARKLGIRPKGDGDNEISLQFPNGARLVGLPGSEATVRGFSAVSLMIIDEAARVSDELYKTLRPMTAVSGGDMLLMSTPFGKRGFFLRRLDEQSAGSRSGVGTDRSAGDAVRSDTERGFGRRAGGAGGLVVPAG